MPQIDHFRSVLLYTWRRFIWYTNIRWDRTIKQLHLSTSPNSSGQSSLIIAFYTINLQNSSRAQLHYRSDDREQRATGFGPCPTAHHPHILGRSFFSIQVPVSLFSHEDGAIFITISIFMTSVVKRTCPIGSPGGEEEVEPTTMTLEQHELSIGQW